MIFQAGTPIALLAALAPPFTAPLRVYGCTRLCVVEFGGADNTGKTEATAAFQKCIDALPKAGGIVHVPAGLYSIDAVKGVKLRSNMWLQMDDGAILAAKTCDVIRYGILRVNGLVQVRVSGGRLRGDRDTHIFALTGNVKTDTHEWCHCIQCYGSSHITFENVTLEKAPGDGISMSAQDVDGDRKPEACDDIVLYQVTSTGNRRQAVSVGKSTNVDIRECELSYTNGTSPECGIDVEPEDGGETRSVRVIGCWIHHNAKNGITILRRSDVDSPISDLRIQYNVIEYNVNGIKSTNVNGVDVSYNRIVWNTATGYFIDAGSMAVKYVGNTSGFNYSRLGAKDRPDGSYTGYKSSLERDILIRNDPKQNTIGTNTYI